MGFYGGFMGFYGGLMGFYGGLMGFYGGFMGFKMIYPLVMTNSLRHRSHGPVEVVIFRHIAWWIFPYLSIVIGQFTRG